MHQDKYKHALYMHKAKDQLHFSNHKNHFRNDHENANFYYYSKQPIWQTANKRAVLFLSVFGSLT
jgi:hypothetical protein